MCAAAREPTTIFWVSSIAASLWNLGSANGWYKISYNGGAGYVSAEYVQKGAPPEDVPPSTNDMLTKDLDIDTTLKVGSTGSKVKDLQTALNIQGFYSGAIDGVYDSAVQSAVKAFQKAAGLDADGIAGNYTLATVYTLLDPIPKSQLNLKAYDDGSSIPIIKPSWSEANNLLPRRATFTVVDVRTGYTFRATVPAVLCTRIPSRRPVRIPISCSRLLIANGAGRAARSGLCITACAWRHP